MSATEEYFRIIYETKGEQALANLQSQLQSVRDEIAELVEANKTGIVIDEAFTQSAKNLGAEKARLQTQIKGLTAVMGGGGGGGAGADTLEGSTVNASRAMQSMAIIMNELAMGRVRGMTASVGQLVQSLGGAGGTAGLIGMFALLGVELYRNREAIEKWSGLWDEYYKNVERAKEETTRLKDEIKKLNETPLKTAVEMQDLRILEQQLERDKASYAAFQKMMTGEPSVTKRAGKRAADALEEAPQGGELLTTALITAEIKRSPEGLAAFQKQQDIERGQAELSRVKAEAERLGIKPEQHIEFHKVTQDLAEAERQFEVLVNDAVKTAKNAVGKAQEEMAKGHAAGRTDMAARLREIGEAKLAAQVESSTPDVLREEDIAELEDKVSKDQIKEREKEIKERNKVHDTERKEKEKAAKEAEDEKYDAEYDEQVAMDRRIEESGKTISDRLKAQRKAERTGDRAETRQENAAEQRAINLMEHGWSAMAAQQEAMAETIARSEHLAVRYAMLQRNATNLTGQARRIGRQIEMGDLEMSLLNSGVP